MLFYCYHHLSQATFDDDVLFILFFSTPLERWQYLLEALIIPGVERIVLKRFSHEVGRGILSVHYYMPGAPITQHTRTAYIIPMSSYWKPNRGNSTYVPIVCVFSSMRPVISFPSASIGRPEEMPLTERCRAYTTVNTPCTVPLRYPVTNDLYDCYYLYYTLLLSIVFYTTMSIIDYY
jgi:hypothetical protein